MAKATTFYYLPAPAAAASHSNKATTANNTKYYVPSSSKALKRLGRDKATRRMDFVRRHTRIVPRPKGVGFAPMNVMVRLVVLLGYYYCEVFGVITMGAAPCHGAPQCAVISLCVGVGVDRCSIGVR